jgi:hypothetical protein
VIHDLHSPYAQPTLGGSTVAALGGDDFSHVPVHAAKLLSLQLALGGKGLDRAKKIILSEVGLALSAVRLCHRLRLSRNEASASSLSECVSELSRHELIQIANSHSFIDHAIGQQFEPCRRQSLLMARAAECIATITALCLPAHAYTVGMFSNLAEIAVRMNWAESSISQLAFKWCLPKYVAPVLTRRERYVSFDICKLRLTIRIAERWVRELETQLEYPAIEMTEDLLGHRMPAGFRSPQMLSKLTASLRSIYAVTLIDLEGNR